MVNFLDNGVDTNNDALEYYEGVRTGIFKKGNGINMLQRIFENSHQLSDQKGLSGQYDLDTSFTSKNKGGKSERQD